jgi:ABC-type amino acid transport substrate-binding protein
MLPYAHITGGGDDVARQVALTAIGSLLLAACAAGESPAPPDATQSPPESPSGTTSTAWCDEYDFNLVEPGALTVATYGSSVPDIEVLPDQQLGGMEGAMFNNFVEECGLELRLFETDFAPMILAVQEGDADVGTYIYYSPDRAEVVYYTYPHWVDDVAVVYTRADFEYTGPESFEGRQVGTVTGFVWASFLQEHFGDDAALFPDEATGGTALINGQIDGWINASAAISGTPWADSPIEIAQHPIEVGDFGMPEEVISNESYNIVSCDNKELAQALNENLERMVESGEWDAVREEFDVPEEEGPRLEEPTQGC